MDNFDITTVPITAKLTLIRGGAMNFRSIGTNTKEQPFHIVNFYENSNSLVSAEHNGVGKSSAWEYLPYYAITGQSSRKGDKVDSLVNSTVNKNMLVFLEWHFAGTYYRLERGRKPTLFNILSLVDNEWIEIPDLPVSSTDRQNYLLSLMGLEKASANSVIENTVLLSGSRFKGFSSLSTPERRLLVEPLLDLTIFSALNTETKSKITELKSEQKQTMLEITEYDKRVALSSQSLQHSESELLGLRNRYNTLSEVLSAEVSNCTALLKSASEIDTGGLELKEKFKILSEENKNSIKVLGETLQNNIENLGVFVINPDDKVLLKLAQDINNLETALKQANMELEDKEASVGDEVKQKKANIESILTDLENTYKKDQVTLADEINNRVDTLKGVLEDNSKDVEEAASSLKSYQENFESSAKYKGDLSVKLKDVLSKEEKYLTNINKLKEAKVYVESQIETQENNLSGLVEAGQCPSCKQHISEEYIEELKEGITEKLKPLKEQLETYTSRIIAGESKVQELNVTGVKLDYEGVCQTFEITKASVERCKQAVEQKTQLALSLSRELSKAKGDYDKDIKSLEQDYLLAVSGYEAKLQGIQHSVEAIVGESKVKYEQLKANLPNQKKNLLQQIEDRKGFLKNEHSVKEQHLREVYEIELNNLKSDLTKAEKDLEEDLTTLVETKDYSIGKCKESLEKAEAKQREAKTQYENELSLSETKVGKLRKELALLQSSLSKFNKEYNKQEADVEDYQALLVLLADDEGKADIVDNYLPLLNAKVNEYLQALNMFIDIKIDSEFNISMTNEDRRNQTLFSLSAGQKARLDLSIMLAFREIAMASNTVNCSLLVLDEVLEPFSNAGIQEAVQMLKIKFADLNVCVISQRKDELSELFDKVHCYDLRGGYTVEIDNE